MSNEFLIKQRCTCGAEIIFLDREPVKFCSKCAMYLTMEGKILEEHEYCHLLTR